MEKTVLASFRETLGQGRRGRIVVPTATLSEHLQHELVRDGLVFRARDVSTLAQFVKELAPEIAVVSDDLFHLMVEDAVIRLDLPEFQKVAALAGFHSRLAKTIQELESAGCKPEQLTGPVVANWQDVDRQLSERKLVMRGQSLRIAAEMARRGSPAAQIWFEGFAQLSVPEKELITALGLSLPEKVLTGNRAARTILLVPESAEREVEEIARRVMENPSFREVGVVLRKPEKYVPLLRAAFDRFGIPAHFYSSEPLTGHPAVRLCTGIVEALLNGWEHERVLELLRFIPNAGISDSVDELSVKIRENLPGRGLEDLLEMAGARVIPRRILKSLQQLDGWRVERRTPVEWAARLTHLPSSFGPVQIPDNISREEAQRYRSYAAGLKEFATGLEAAASWWVDPSEVVDLARFWRVVRSVLRMGSFATNPRSRNVVHVISVWEARQWDLNTIFICGMVEKDFPTRNARDPFFSDATLGAIGARTSQDKDREERALFDEVCSRARHLLVLSYPRVDARGQRNLKSIFLSEVEEVEDPVEVVRPALPVPIAPWLQTSRIQAPDLMEKIAGRHIKISVTRLETLLQCPFRFFAEETLHTAKPAVRPENRLDFLVQGSIAHDVLKEWFDSREDLEPLFRRIFDAACVKYNIQPGFRTDRVRRLIFIALHNFVTAEQERPPLHSRTEQSFVLPLDEHLTVSGKLDRIDELEDGGVLVVDYKFSSGAATKKRISDETKLQGPLYAWAVEQQLGRKAEGMVYVSLKGGEKPEYFGWGSVPGASPRNVFEIPPDWIPNALKRASSAAAELRSGTVHPRPATTGPCRYCDYRDACRVEQPLAIPAAGS
jgi:RecB family exonuclease